MTSLLSHFSNNEKAQLRFFIGVIIAIALAFAVNWPFAFITPVFVAKFLTAGTQKLSFKQLFSIFVIISSAFIMGSFFTSTFINYPIVFLLLMTLVIFWLSYWNNSGGNELAITMMLVGFTVVPMLALIHPEVAVQFNIGFLFSCLVSLLITLVMHELISDDEVTAPKAKAVNSLDAKSVRVQYALMTTLMVMPVISYFLYYKIADALLVMVFIAILAQKPDLIAGVKGAKALLVANAIAGIAAMLMYGLLLIVPTYTALILLFALLVIIFTQKIFSDSPYAPLFAMAFTTVIILVSGATSSDADASDKFLIRLFQIACACSYVILATAAALPWIKRISEQVEVK